MRRWETGKRCGAGLMWEPLGLERRRTRRSGEKIHLILFEWRRRLFGGAGEMMA